MCSSSRRRCSSSRRRRSSSRRCCRRSRRCCPRNVVINNGRNNNRGIAAILALLLLGL